MKIAKFAAASAVVLSGVVMSTGALAGGGGGGSADCSVTEVSPFGSDTTFFVPSGGPGTYNILGWGNGTGGTVGSYDGMLEAAAEHCVLVAAAETSQSGSGADVEEAVNEARSRYANIVGSNPKICTSGHSQGGGGSFNAANRLGADCIIAVQPDTVYTVSIYRPVASDTDVVCIFTSGDTLAPAYPFNDSNCEDNSPRGRYTMEMGSGTHFAPNSGTGGDPGEIQREYIDLWMR
ncbi:hypothetical protein [Aurantivibrio plasticivorans]